MFNSKVNSLRLKTILGICQKVVMHLWRRKIGLGHFFFLYYIILMWEMCIELLIGCWGLPSFSHFFPFSSQNVRNVIFGTLLDVCLMLQTAICLSLTDRYRLIGALIREVCHSFCSVGLPYSSFWKYVYFSKKKLNK